LGETSKAFARRQREGFFHKYFKGKGIDIGCGTDKVLPTADEWDLYQVGQQGDATFMEGVHDDSYDWVYSSHCLEHLEDPSEALKSWWRILRIGGNLIIFIPHRDLYEKREFLPSRWNMEHKKFYVIGKHQNSDTLGILQTLEEVLGTEKFEILLVRKCDDGHTITEPTVHSDGEYSIEVVVKKLK
jgi:predicted SAM-dependent methyltransferase